MLAPNMCFYCP